MRRTLLFLMVLAAALPLSPAPISDKSGNKKKTSTTQGTAQFSSRAELVMVPVIVNDGAGKPVEHLNKDAFHLYEDNAEQKIAVFDEVSTTNERPASEPPAGEHVFSNRPAGQEEAPRRLTILVLDTMNTPAEAQMYARRELFNYLSDLITSKELFSVMTMDAFGVHMVYDFTQDPKALMAALNRLKSASNRLAAVAPGTPVATPTIDPTLADATNVNTSSDPMGALDRQLDVLAAGYEKNDEAAMNLNLGLLTTSYLRSIARRYAPVPGRKSLIWITGGFPFQISDAIENWKESDIRSQGRAALVDIEKAYDLFGHDFNHAQMSLYAVDARGLFGTQVMDASQRLQSYNASQTQQTAHDDHFQISESQGTMTAFADMTGGRAFINSNDLKKAFDASVRDGEHYYLLGYYVHSKKKPGWHHLNIKLQPGAAPVHTDVRARNGYYVARAATGGENARNEDMNAAVMSPLDYSQIGLTATWGETVKAADASTRRVQFRLAAAPGFATIDDGDANHFIFDVVALVKTPEGKPAVAPFRESLESRLKSASADRIRREGITYQNWLELPPGDYTVRFVVRDGLSGRMGSVAAPLHVAQ